MASTTHLAELEIENPVEEPTHNQDNARTLIRSLLELLPPRHSHVGSSQIRIWPSNALTCSE